jgi:hypothetical protein
VACTLKLVSLVRVNLKVPESPIAFQETESGKRTGSTDSAVETVEVLDLGPVLSFWQERRAINAKRGPAKANRTRIGLGSGMGLYLGAMGSNPGRECRTLEEAPGDDFLCVGGETRMCHHRRILDQRRKASR